MPIYRSNAAARLRLMPMDGRKTSAFGKSSPVAFRSLAQLPLTSTPFCAFKLEPQNRPWIAWGALRSPHHRVYAKHRQVDWKSETVSSNFTDKSRPGCRRQEQSLYAPERFEPASLHGLLKPVPVFENLRRSNTAMFTCVLESNITIPELGANSKTGLRWLSVQCRLFFRTETSSPGPCSRT